MPFQNEAAALPKEPYPTQTGPFQSTSFAKPALRRAPPGAGLSLLAAMIETALIACVVIVAFLSFRPAVSLGGASWAAMIGLPLFSVLILTQRQFYTTHHLLFAPFQPFRLTGAWIGAFGATVVVATLARSIEPQRLRHIGVVPSELTILFVTGLTALLGGRLAWAAIRPRFALRAIPRVLFIGALDSSRRLLTQLHAETSIALVTSLDYRDPAIELFGPDAQSGALSNRVRLTALLERENIDAVLVPLPQVPQADIAVIAAAAQSCGVATVALPGLSLRRDPAAGFTTLGGVPVLQRDTTRLSPIGMVQKRLFDLIVGALVLLIIAPVMLIIAALIRLDSPGPVLFRQLRVGRGGTLFEILKFRTMAASASSQPDQPDAPLQTERNDRRVTRLGAILRRHSLDELPQIFNVLRGDMSIIGPRPHAAAMTVAGMKLEALVPDYPDRFAVRPGITGWAQINGRRGIIDSVDALQNRVDHDLYYIENWSFGFDIVILLRTIGCIIRDDQAF
ncbi:MULTISPECIES: sugar transferase [Acidiphilium]|uniref:Exopolysaccharide biosynthesis polyprenyl glycosylphosphotransferase n=1 Tax=Acidiphilium rubrum TaxID=526 RepID=A0A8G2CLA7_ACIRU|nr:MULTISPECIES: sugar transferase [Acidiphilium]SIQ96460.1 exopolysaccharide biosynthesis polyprenyl glycosylphosphotransferase [Acidiphilium rubrum]